MTKKEKEMLKKTIENTKEKLGECDGCNALEEQVKNLTTENEILTKQNEELSQSLEKYQNDIDNLETEIAELRIMVGDKKRINSGLKFPPKLQGEGRYYENPF